MIHANSISDISSDILPGIRSRGWGPAGSTGHRRSQLSFGRVLAANGRGWGPGKRNTGHGRSQLRPGGEHWAEWLRLRNSLTLGRKEETHAKIEQPSPDGWGTKQWLCNTLLKLSLTYEDITLFGTGFVTCTFTLTCIYLSFLISNHFFKFCLRICLFDADACLHNKIFFFRGFMWVTGLLIHCAPLFHWLIRFYFCQLESTRGGSYIVAT